MSNTNKICYVCGKSYRYCNSCNDYANQPLWKEMFDTDNCKKIYYAVSSYAQKSIDVTTAYKQLKECDLKNKNSFSESIVKFINEIQKNGARTEKRTTKPQETKKKDQID